MLAIQPLGDTGARVELGQEISPAVHARVVAFCRSLERQRLAGVAEWVPGYASVTVFYRPDAIRYEELCARLQELTAHTDAPAATAEVVCLPVLYGGEWGADLDFVAQHSGLQAAEVIAAHSRPEYLVYMIGFAPGFPYLGGMDPRIAAPRLASPRRGVPAGAVGIAGSQTGVYPIETPGGWRIIGRTPVRLFDARREPPILLQAGQRLKFEPISAAEYARIEAQAALGNHAVTRRAAETNA